MRSSKVSSMATIRSSSGRSSMRALSNVVLPDPVPPETRMLRRDRNTRSRADLAPFHRSVSVLSAPLLRGCF